MEMFQKSFSSLALLIVMTAEVASSSSAGFSGSGLFKPMT